MNFYLTFLFLIFPLVGQVINSPTIETLISKVEKPFWLVVDLDNTIFEGKEALGHSHWFDDQFIQESAKGLTKPQIVEKLYITWTETQKVNQVQPVEERFISWIHELQKDGVPVFALTARQPVLAASTNRQLASIGLDFSLTAPKGELKTSFEYPILYEKGVIYVHDLNEKGALLSAFLDDNNLQPPKILFVDDKLHHAEAVDAALTKRGIEVIALHYTALMEREPIYNATIAKFQKEKFQKLLSNDEALLLLHHQPDIHQ